MMKKKTMKVKLLTPAQSLNNFPEVLYMLIGY